MTQDTKLSKTSKNNVVAYPVVNSDTDDVGAAPDVMIINNYHIHHTHNTSNNYIVNESFWSEDIVNIATIGLGAIITACLHSANTNQKHEVPKYKSSKKLAKTKKN